MELHISGIITLIICIIYGITLQHIAGKRPDNKILLKAFAFVFLIGWVVHLSLFLKMSASDGRTLSEWLQLLFFSVQYALDMFVTKTIMFKSAVASTLQSSAILQTAYVTTYFMAVITSALVIFHYVSRWAYGRRWLHRSENIKAAEEGGNHLFLGTGRESRMLAADIRKRGDKGKIIFIDLPDSESTIKGISIWNIISGFLGRNSQNIISEADVVLRADKRMKGLVPWLRNRDNNVYILSDDQKKNLELLECLWNRSDMSENEVFQCRIYCHADKSGLVSRYDTVTDIHDRIRFVDSSFLAVESLKNPEAPEMFPYNYVDAAIDPGTGRKTGCIASGFTSAIIGFGETGHEALKFLYEFGAFAGTDGEKAAFRCHIYDNNAAEAAGELRRSVTFPDKEEVQFIPCSVDSEAFWKHIESIIKDVNYLVICLGDDKLNLKIAIDIAEFALCHGRDLSRNFVIALRQQACNGLNMETLKKAGKTFGNCIKPFGMEKDIWKVNVIRPDHLDDLAREFHSGYMALTSDGDADKAWHELDGKLRNDDYETRTKARRQITQNYSNCLHMHTKKALCDSETAAAASHIRCAYDGNGHIDMSCPDFEASVLDNLARSEHIRWNASHIMLGYRYGIKTSDLMHTHNCLVPYNGLDEATKHYDWLVVKRSLI